MNKNLFKLKDLRIKLEGSSNKSEIEYEMHLDFANIVSGEHPVLDAYVKFNYPINTTLGFQKLPFSRHSMIAIIYSPWLKRAQIIDEGQTRRDVGLHLKKAFLNEKIQIYGSVVNGEKDLVQENDKKAGVEYIGRVELAYPAKIKYRAIDIATSPIPVFSLGTSYRQSTKGQNAFYDDEIYHKINGTKKSYGADFAMMFRGFSLLGEYHFIDYDWDQDTYPDRENWKTTGCLFEGNYFFKKYKSVLALRYDNTRINFYNMGSDDGNLGVKKETISIGYNFRINSHLNVLKIQFKKEINGGVNHGDPSKYEIRIGLQYLIG